MSRKIEEVRETLALYGAGLTEDGLIVSPKGRVMSTKVAFKGARLRVMSADSVTLFSGAADSIGKFVEKFWFWEKVK